MRKIYLLFLLLFGIVPCYSQVNVQFVPEVYGRNLNGLFSCKFINMSQKLSASLQITVTERGSGVVCRIRVPAFELFNGTNQLPLSASRTAAIQFGGSKLAGITSQSRNFPEGDYEYCFELTFKNTDNAPLEQCFSYTLAPFAELNLIDPYNQDKICNKRPMLTWQPLLPGVAGSYYQLVLSEIKGGQNATEALNYNIPVINQGNLISPLLNYPSIARELEQGKKYAWQVTAYKDQTILNRSEVWEFTVDCQDSVKKVVVEEAYRDIEDLSKGNYYIANGSVRFSFVNPYQAQDLKYEMQAIANPDKKIRRLPKLKLANGDNRISINLAETASFTNGNYYVMKVYLPGGEIKSLRFLYQEPK